MQDSESAVSKPLRSIFVTLVPLLCILLVLLLVAGYFYSGKLQQSDETELKAGSIAAIEQPVSAPLPGVEQAENPMPAEEPWQHLINSVTRCYGEYAYAGTNGSDYVSICVTPEGLLYQAYVANGILRRPAREVTPGNFEVDAGAHTIVVEADSVDVLDQSGGLALEVTLPEWRDGSFSRLVPSH